MTAAPVSQRPARRMWRRFLQHRLAVGSLIGLAALCVLAAAAPIVEQILDVDANTANLFGRLAPPSWDNPLGTDELGRDLLVRLLYGGQVSLAVGIAAAIFSAIIGTTIGLVAGYQGGIVDKILMRFNDAVIALPVLPLLIVLAAVDLEKLGLPRALVQSENISLYRIIVIVALVGWNTVARLVRAETLALREREFVRAAVALGAPAHAIMLRHILPNAISPIIVATTLSVGSIILFESILSFLGLGIQPPTASWGNMLTNAQEIIWSTPLLAFWPGFLIFITVIAFNFLGDGLQDALDPRALD